jgi:hypothetical protein
MTIETPDGEGILEQLYFTELGHVMAKIYNKKTKTWINKRIGDLQTLLVENNIEITGQTTYKKSTLKNLK